jgi:release factor glutamine methyltransferase
LERGRAVLFARSPEGARREALFLLTGLLGIKPAAISLQADRLLDDRELAEYESRLARRAAGEPLQYIEGRAAFRDLWLRVDRSVLIPRPETEQLVQCVLDWCRGRDELKAIDLGTGSGAISISLAVEGPFTDVVGVDISPEALKVARVNAGEAAVEDKLDLRLGSLFGAVRAGERFDVIVSNPPYVAERETDTLPEEVREWEPAVALYAGPTGFEVIEQIVNAAPRHLDAGGLLALEVAPSVADAALDLVRSTRGYGQERIVKDLAGQWRILLAERR